ncbi:uncharacterized protein, partial [Palaemon carinicauda]|uniref:uncharacterized protein n=1 Tax=Palaemon carinicauda TaxID=392227 RepID=UPI0035B61933
MTPSVNHSDLITGPNTPSPVVTLQIPRETQTVPYGNKKKTPQFNKKKQANSNVRTNISPIWTYPGQVAWCQIWPGSGAKTRFFVSAHRRLAGSGLSTQEPLVAHQLHRRKYSPLLYSDAFAGYRPPNSDEEEPLTITFEEDTIQDDLVDNETLLREDNEDQLLVAEEAETAHEERRDFAVSHAPVEMRSRKRRRGPLCPAEGVALKRLPDNSYMARDNTKWHSEPNPTMPPILKIDQFDTAGPTMALFGCRTPAEVFDKFLTYIMLAEVVIHTNDKIITLRNKYKRQSDPTFKDLTLMELRAFLGILIMTGARKDNHLTAEEMFSKSLGCPFYRSILSERRFAFIQRALRFDSIATREEHVRHDKFAPIRNLWDQVIANCIANYEPSGHLTVDEQLLAFRGRCGFRMYIPNKPAKYGIKLVMACDADTFYMCNAIPYL